MPPGNPIVDLWRDDPDRYSFADSDRFEEDSLCSWSSEQESLCNNWRGWKKNSYAGIVPTVGAPNSKKATDGSRVPQLCELAVKCVATHIPFELVENVFPPVPEQLQLRIAFWSFPDNEEDIRLYSCLANSSSDEFQRGEHLFKSKAVKDPLQIGFHLSATVIPPPTYNQRGQFNVAVAFDRGRITSCNCTCDSSAYWCAHIVAVCLQRIHQPLQVCLRAPVSESLSRLRRDQLQKFAQYLISELPQQILPTAQRILDELLSSVPSDINSVCGAPDPTAGASIHEQTSWYLDEKTLHDNIKKILVKFCVPSPMVFSDVNYLSNTAPPAAAEWSSLLRPLRGREPEGMWNLLSIVREMYKRNDGNALPLLHIITEECMTVEQIMVWWFNTKVAMHIGVSTGGKHSGINSSSHAAQHACASLCDEVVILWRLAALNPALSPEDRNTLLCQFKDWHLKTLDKVEKSRLTISNSSYQSDRLAKNITNSVEVFTGFKPAIASCHLDWKDYQIPGVTYQDDTASWLAQSFTCFKTSESKSDTTATSSQGSQRGTHHNNYHSFCYRGRRYQVVNGYNTYNRLFIEDENSSLLHLNIPSVVDIDDNVPDNTSGNRSSVSSEGFCEQEVSTNRNDDIVRDFVNSRDIESSSSEDSDTGKDETPPSGGSKSPTQSKSTSVDAIDEKLPRRFSKDDSLSSDSQQSGDEYYMYYYDPKEVETQSARRERLAREKREAEEEDRAACVEVAAPVDPWDILFARAEGLHAHGHNKEASILGVRLAKELLVNPPNLMIDLPLMPSKGKRKKQINPFSHQISVLASDTLAKCAFLCTVLAEYPEYYHLAFKVGLYGLEMCRPPATTKPLEVKLFNQESELVTFLKRILLGENELEIIRSRAQLFKDGKLRSRGDALLPLSLASYVLDALTMPIRESRCQFVSPNLRQPGDEELGAEAAVAALGLKANVSEADHPLLCEGTRRQRGELAVTLLVHYKNNPKKICQIMEKLLDPEVHVLIKTPLLPTYYTTHPPIKSATSTWNDRHQNQDFQSDTPICVEGLGCRQPVAIEHMTLDSLLAPPVNTTPTVSAPPLPSTNRKDHSHTGGPTWYTRRYKGKRAYPSIPNQPSEASAHFMFELAKTVLAKAGGSSTTSLFTQASTSQNVHGPHHALHMCAFQLGLYALGLHNCVSPNWLSRTYSSHVSWIASQAMEIGAPAISFLQDTWDGHLTPPEAANMADRASGGCDRNLTYAAAELALSCLPHAHALNPNEIQRAILQCKEQSDRMLEKSCLTVEAAAKGGGVYPEVLFQVAKYWYELYLKHSPQQVVEQLNDDTPVDVVENVIDTQAAAVTSPQPTTFQTAGTASPATPIATAVPYSIFAVTTAPPPTHFHHPHHHHHNQIATLQPQVFLPGPDTIAGSYLPTPYQYYPSTATHVFTPAIQVGSTQNPIVTIAPTQPSPVAQPVMAVAPAPTIRPATAQVGRPQQHYTSCQMRYLVAAYRVGMLAMETIARRVHDDRPNMKFARNPPYGSDVKWLLGVSQKLGTQYLHQFCMCVVNSIVSPFVLHDVALEAAHFLSRGNPSLVVQHLRSSLTPLITKCHQMYFQCLHQKLYHLTNTEHEEFISIVMSARAAFHITPEGSTQFKEWLQSLRRSKQCKKDLWTQLNVVLAQAGK